MSSIYFNLPFPSNLLTCLAVFETSFFVPLFTGLSSRRKIVRRLCQLLKLLWARIRRCSGTILEWYQNQCHQLVHPCIRRNRIFSSIEVTMCSIHVLALVGWLGVVHPIYLPCPLPRTLTTQTHKMLPFLSNLYNKRFLCR